MKVGMAIKPKTSVSQVTNLLPHLDYVLVMTVEPGFGGQKLISECIPKITEIKGLQPNLTVQVDGGVTLENLASLTEAGADVFVAGTLIFGASDPKATIHQMKGIIANNKK
jgi:ribulose-phosphate 3-epimerase